MSSEFKYHSEIKFMSETNCGYESADQMGFLMEKNRAKVSYAYL
jgi:hypothetical protein